MEKYDEKWKNMMKNGKIMMERVKYDEKGKNMMKRGKI